MNTTQAQKLAAIPVQKNNYSLLQFIIALFELDFICQPWYIELGKVVSIKVGTDYMFNMNSEGIDGQFNPNRTFVITRPQYLLEVETRQGTAEVEVTKLMYDFKQAGNFFLVKVQVSRLGRIRMVSAVCHQELKLVISPDSAPTDLS